MILTEHRLTVADIGAAEQPPRSPGLHASTIIRAIMVDLDPAQNTRGFNPLDTINWREIGWLWEEIIGQGLFARRGVVKPGEIVKDGIIRTPDWLGVGPAIPDPTGALAWAGDQPYVGETKATWKSARGFDLYSPKFLPWLLQMRDYCDCLEIPNARLTVLWLNGDYTRYVPEIREYDLSFTDRELAENREQLLNTAKAKGLL